MSKDQLYFACCRHGGGNTWFYFDDRSCIYTDAFRTGYFQCKTYQGGSTGLPFGVCVYDIRCVA